jgi:hypothetical protein
MSLTSARILSVRLSLKILKKKLSACYVPHALTAEQDDEWLQVSCEEKHYRSLPGVVKNGNAFLSKKPALTCQIWHLQAD